jgi:glycosyltransferase involved in cell wall biosynthesis
VLVAHVRYRNRGGEDQVFDDEVALLRAGGVDACTLDVPSVSLRSLGAVAALETALSGGDHAYGRALMRGAISAHRPDVVHFHNIYPLLGIGAMREARGAGCGVVRTYHNYRLSCIAGTHFYRGSICERCAPGRRVPGIVRGCYRGSRLQSAAMAIACEAEWRSFTEDGLPDVALCQTAFARQRLIAYGAPEDRVVVKPNSVKAHRAAGPEERSGAVFVGRLSPEKGIAGLAGAWPCDLPLLTVVGDGPLARRLADCRRANVSMAGAAPRDEARILMSRARVVIVPSLCYEGFPLVIAEAFAVGTPVVCFDHGGLSEVGQSVSAECVAPTGDFRALVDAAAAVLKMRRAEWSALSELARAAYQRSHTRERSLAALLAIYSRVIR